MKKVRRLICIIMTVFILVIAPVNSYNQVQAMELVGSMEILQALLEIFGVTVGLGNQSVFFSQSSFDDFATAVSNGKVYHMDQYGDVDFSDNDSVMNWLEWANGIDEYITTSGWSPVTKYETAIKAGAGIIDYASYKMTGTSATTAMHNYINDAIEYFDVSGGGTISLDAQDAYGFFSGSGAGDNDDDDDEQKQKKYMTRFKAFTAITSGMILTLGDKLTSLVSLKHPENSDFSEYDAAFENGFEGNYYTDASGQYICDVYYEANGGMDNGFKICRYKWHYVGSRKVFGYLYSSGADSRYAFGYFLGDPIVSNYKSLTIGSGIQSNLTSGSGGGLSNSSSVVVLSDSSASNVPIFTSLDTAADYFTNGDISGILNFKNAEAYSDFKNNAASAARLGKYLGSWLLSPTYLNNLSSMIKPVLETSDVCAGLLDGLDDVEDAIKELVPDDTVVDPDPVPDDSTNYSGILGKILAAINKIISLLNPTTYVAAFAKKFITADALTELLNTMPQLFAEAFANALVLPLTPVIAAIDAIPESMVSSLALPDVIADAITSVFPRINEVGDAIIAFPDAVADAVGSIAIDVPDIKIPEITIPDVITITKLDISELSVPAMANPVINLTLDPTYDITVANDFTGLDSVIATAVQGVLTVCFVPDEVMTMQKMGEMKAYFKFVDQITYSVNGMLEKFMNITPTPYLKIPLGHIESKYNYGLGEYWIIDISWYAKYKSFGDRVFLAICWIFFLWYLFVKLPGIIAGMEGSIMQANNSAEFTNDLIYPKFRPNSGKVNTPQDYSNAEKVNWHQRFTRRY